MENFIELWQNLIKAPEATLKGKKGGLSEAAMNAAVMAVLSGIVIAILGVVGGLAVAGVIGGIVMAVMYFIFFFVGAAIVFVIAKLLGSKSSYESNAYYLSLVFTLTPPLMLVNGILAFIPLLGGLVSLVIGLYVFYIEMVAIKVANAFTVARAVAVVVVMMVLVGLVALVILAVSGLALLGLAAAAANA